MIPIKQRNLLEHLLTGGKKEISLSLKNRTRRLSSLTVVTALALLGLLLSPSKYGFLVFERGVIGVKSTCRELSV